MKRTKFIAAVCLIAQAFTSFVLSFVYANRKKELSHAFLGLGILGGLGGAYLLYSDYMENKKERLAFEDGEWDDGEFDEDLFDEDNADDINFTIAEENEGEKNETEEDASEEKTEEEPKEDSEDK